MEKLARLGRTVTIVAVTFPAVAALLAAGSADTLKTQIDQRLRLRDDQAAAGLIERHLERQPADAVMLYNAACVQCRLGEIDLGAAFLLRAIKAGFADVSHARRDPDLRPLHGHPVFRAIVDARDAADETLARRQMQAWRRQLGEAPYRYEVDTTRRIITISALDETADASVHRLLETHTDHLQQTLFPSTPSYVLVLIPTRDDAASLLTRPHVRGLYNHRRRELVTFGHPRALRHELAHALHHGHMDELGQEHPLWIQEGLASLYETYDVDDDGTARFGPNDRHEHVKTLAINGWLLSWSDLAALKPEALQSEAFRVYPQLRSIFRFFADRGKLESWYRAYTDSFDTDETGITAIATVFDRPITEVEAAWRRWLDSD